MKEQKKEFESIALLNKLIDLIWESFEIAIEIASIEFKGDDE